MTNLIEAAARGLRLAFLRGGLVIAATGFAASGAAADPFKIYAAGSLVGPVKELIAASGIDPKAFADPTFGPAGLLRKRIEGGETADLYMSADLAQPRKLVESGKASVVVPFAENRLCVLGKESLGLTPDTLLDKLSDGSVRLATSTPEADPGGDYALAVFAKADALKAGSGEALKAKSLKLLGTPGAMTPIAGKSASATVFLSDKADALLYYCSGQTQTMKDAPGLALTQLPAALSVNAIYSLTTLSDNPDAARFALFVLSEKGQAILAKHELIPLIDPN